MYKAVVCLIFILALLSPHQLFSALLTAVADSNYLPVIPHKSDFSPHITFVLSSYK